MLKFCSPISSAGGAGGSSVAEGAHLPGIVDGNNSFIYRASKGWQVKSDNTYADIGPYHVSSSYNTGIKFSMYDVKFYSNGTMWGGYDLSGFYIGTEKVRLLATATGILEQRNGNTAQEYQLANAYTDASNYSRSFQRWNSSEFQYGIESLGAPATGATSVSAWCAGTNVFSYSATLFQLHFQMQIREQAAAVANTSQYGQVWVKDEAPNELWFDDDAGNSQMVSQSGIRRTIKLEHNIQDANPSDQAGEDSEVSLRTVTIPSGTLDTAGDEIRIESFGTSVSTNVSLQPSYKIQVDTATLFDLANFAVTDAGSWKATVKIIRYTNLLLYISAELTFAPDADYSNVHRFTSSIQEAVSALDGNDLDIEFLGTNDGADNDLTEKAMQVDLIKTY